VHNPWSIVGFVALLVLGIAAVQALIWIPIIVRWRGKARAASAKLAAAIESEVAIRLPEKGVYRGATAPDYPVVNNNGTIALTERRLIFVTVTGKLIDIPVAEIAGVREAKVFKTSVRGGRSHLIVQLRSGEVAFFVLSTADWINAITSLRKG
jgi:multidrug efflux pump subunit AcrA (membrane-fusion protein)